MNRNKNIYKAHEILEDSMGIIAIQLSIAEKSVERLSESLLALKVVIDKVYKYHDIDKFSISSTPLSDDGEYCLIVRLSYDNEEKEFRRPGIMGSCDG